MVDKFKIFTNSDLGSYNKHFISVLANVKDEGFKPGSLSNAVELALKKYDVNNVETITSVAFNGRGDLKIIPYCSFVKKLGVKGDFKFSSGFSSGFFKLNDDVFNSLDGFHFFGDEYDKIMKSKFKSSGFFDNSFFNMFVFDKYSSNKKIIKNNPLWRALLNDDVHLLSDYVDFVFEKNDGKSNFMHPFNNPGYVHYVENLNEGSNWFLEPHITNIRLGSVDKGSHCYLVNHLSTSSTYKPNRRMLGVKK